MPTDPARRLLAGLRKEVHIGNGRFTDRDVFVPLSELKKTSMHILGAAGYGKSYFLRNLIRQLIKQGQAFALIDPHRDLYEFALSALRRSAVPSKRIVVVDPADDRYSVAFNPLYCGVTDPNDAASLVLEACLKAWGHQSFDGTPRLEGILRGLFRLLLESRLTLLEAPEILNIDNARLRTLLRDRVGDDLVRQDWEEFEKLPRIEKLAVVESSRNRLRRFLQSERVHYMLGQTDNTLNLQDVMDSGKFLLANVGGMRSPETQRLLGTLLVNGIFHAAKQRDPKNPKPYWVLIDECGQFATRDLASSMDELRKFGCHFVLAHQRLRQLEREDDGDILSAVMTNAKIKVVFGGLERPEAERIAYELFTGQVRGDRVKHVNTQMKFRPVLDTFDVETESWSETDSSGESSSSSSTTNSSTSSSSTQTFEGDDESDDDAVTHALQQGVSEMQGHSASRSLSTTRSSASGGSRSTVPITRHEEFQEETGRTYWGIDEQFEALIARVHQLPKREALVRVFNGPVLHIVTPDVREEHDERARERFRDKALKACCHVKSTDEVRAEIDARRGELEKLVNPTKKTVNTNTFRE